MGHKEDKIRKRYNRISKIYDGLEKPMEALLMSQWRKDLIENIEGKKILEIGVGTGKNIKYYSKDVEVTAIDFSKKMLEKASSKIGNKNNIELVEMDVESMKFPDNSFDTLVTSFVFCSVPNPVDGLKEMRRVCKNNGKILMLEHMRSQNRIIGKIMDIINFIPLNIYGANINRKTMKNLKKAGFKEEAIDTQNLWSDIVKHIEIRNIKDR